MTPATPSATRSPSGVGGDLVFDTARQNPTAVRSPGYLPSLDRYSHFGPISEAEIRAALPPDTPEDEAERLTAAELSDLEKHRERRQDARDRLRRATAEMYAEVAASLASNEGRAGVSFYSPEAHRAKKRSVKMRECSESRETLRHMAEGKEGPCGWTWPLEGGEPRWFCGVLECPECQKIKAHAGREISRYISRRGVIRHQLRALTLTMPNVKHLGELVPSRSKRREHRGKLRDVNLLTAAAKCYDLLRELLEDRRTRTKKDGTKTQPRAGVRSCWKCKGFVPTKRTRKIVRELEAAGLKLPETCWDHKTRSRVPWPVLCPCERPDARAHAIHASLRNTETTWKWDTITSPDGDGRAYHVHGHVLADMPWTEHAVLATLWMYCTLKEWPGGPANMLGARIEDPYIKGQDGKKIPLRDVTNHELLARGLMEIVKYPNKVADFLSCPDKGTRVRGFSEWSIAARRRKLKHATGAWKGWDVKLAEAEENDPDELPEGDVDDPDELPCPSCGGIGEWKRVGAPDQYRKSRVAAALAATVPR